MSAPQWYPDPTGRNELRYWDGSKWTEHVNNGGVSAIEPDPANNEPDTTSTEQPVPQPSPVEPAAGVSLDSPEPTDSIDKAIIHWKNQLLDVGGNNRLLYYRDLKAGTLDISSELDDVDELRVENLLSQGGRIRLSDLFQGDEPEESVKRAQKRAKAIHRKALENLEERGIYTLFAAMGMLTWESTTSTSTPNAPLLLFPLELEPSGAGSSDFNLAIAADPEVNPTLLHFLATQHGIDIDAEAVVNEHTDSNGVIQLGSVSLAVLKEIQKAVPSARLVDRTIVGNFSYQKLPMIRDLEQNAGLLRENEVVLAVAGDKKAIESIRLDATSETVSIHEPDTLKPRDEYLTLDCDSSQNEAINRALKGENLVVQGPPGTGKSQTIANLIGCFASQGKSVLFVAEKRAAIEAVNKNLIKTGLTELIMDLHGGSNLKKMLAGNLAAAIEQIKSATEPNTETLDQRLERSRAELGRYVTAIHDDEKYGVSYFDASCELVNLEGCHESKHRVGGEQLAAIDPTRAESLRTAISDFVQLGGLELVAAKSEWLSCNISNDAQTARAIRAFADLRESLRLAQESVGYVCSEMGAASPTSFEESQTLIDTSLKTNVVTQRFTTDFLVGDLPGVATCLDGNGKHGLRKLFSSSYRKAFNQAESSFVGAAPAPDELRKLVGNANRTMSAWSTFSSKPPQAVTWSDEAAARTSDVIAKAQEALEAAGRSDLVSSGPDTYLPFLQLLLAFENYIPKLSRLREAQGSLQASGFGPLLSECAQIELDEDEASELLDFCWYSSIAESISIENTTIGGFEPGLHDNNVAEFKATDGEHLEVAADRIKRRVAAAAIDARNRFPEQDAIVLKEAGKRTRHMPIRDFLTAAPDVIGALRPCWAMSPLLVSQVLPAKSDLFDVVIFDEASQVEPADAIPSIMRAKQVIVAGDTRQLPPTKFFASSAEDADGDDDNAAALTVGFQSILDVLAAALPRHAWLTWHYRSRDERLINFSNAYVYEGMMKTFPGPAGDGCLRLEQADPFGQSVLEDPAIDKVVELCIAHALEHPDRSLGVITLGVGKANKLEDAIHRAIQGRDDLSAFFDEHQDERFFVKNIERVQGDERDTIFLMADLNRSSDGTVANRLGPINQDGGERRLNVAVTRARSSMTLITTFSHHDLPDSRFKSKGATLFRDYVRYAETGGEDLGEAARRMHPLNPFEADVQQRLLAMGIPLIAQFGVAGYRIDFVALDPDDHTRKVLAIEADGASYHSLPTARDRDRLRQSVLENLGWTFHRIWSTSWFRDPDTEVLRAVQAWEAALDPEPAGQTPASAMPTDETTEASSSAPERTKPRPHIIPGDPITAYSADALDEIVIWIKSDGLLRTDDELMRSCQKEMGYGRLGARIKQSLLAAINRTR